MAARAEKDPEEFEVAKSHLGFPVVGIGASAGGVKALVQLLEHMPSDSGMAFVVVVHLSPDHESLLGQILGRTAKMPVVTVVQAVPIEANHVYVISPAMKLAMSDGHLRVSPLTTIEGRRQSIDLFFRSLAQAHRERSVAIVLSGTGTDGAQGIKRIKELGGVTVAQSFEDAEFDGMPRAAAQTGMVDFALPVAEMPTKLLLLWENAKRIELPDPPGELIVERSEGDAELLAEEALLSIKALLRERTGHDFAHYKRATVLRRLERRMQVTAVPDLPSYRRLLESEASETPALLQDMLISVTNFFRDPEAFDALASAIESSLVGRPVGEPYRAWVAGCATGEEAYSVAMLLRGLLGPDDSAVTLFASDIDERAVGLARAGRFPDSIASDVGPDRLREFFVQEEPGYRVSKPLRDSVVFSSHNVLSDPPFTRMDLICCRNLLIYLDRSAQSQLLRSFHFALKPRGVLFLGSSETVDVAEGLYEGIDKGRRVYRAALVQRRAGTLPPIALRLPAFEITAMPPSPKPSDAALRPLEALHDRAMRRYGPPTVLVDGDDTVLYVSQGASYLLRFPEGAPANKLMALARPELRAELRAALARSAQTGRVVEAPRVVLTVNGQARSIVITARPLADELPLGMTLVVFDDSEKSLAPTQQGPDQRDPVVETLENELSRTHEQLRAKVGESAASTEELRASNEELQTINEELRSTTEELETSREELQAVNEELTTVNAELTIRIEETGKANDDLHNLMTSADIGAVFVGRDMRVKRFTPRAAALFNLLPTDEGRSLLDLRHRLEYPELAEDIASVPRDLKRIEREVRGPDGSWLLARVSPYRTGADRIEGAIVALFDVTLRKAAEEQLGLSERRMALIADSMRDYAIVTMDDAGTVATWSPGAARIFGYEAPEAIGRDFAFIFTEADRANGKPRDELLRARLQGRAADGRWHERKDGSMVFCSGITTPLEGASGFAKIVRDLTDEELRVQRRELDLARERATTGRLEEASAMKDQFLAIVSHELKNPLSVISLNAELIARLPDSAASARASSSRTILSAVASQAQIIDDLLDMSRANLGKIALAPTMIDMAQLVGSIVEAIRCDASAKGLSLDAALAPIRLFGDPVRVEQIVWNLLTNAIKFSPNGGHVALALSTEGPMARLSVVDSGIGLEPARLTDIFEMFKQVETGASRAKTGLGIGLALVKQLAELHGGRVAAESAGLGLGSTFTVWLPMERPDVAVTPAAAPTGLQGMRLLVVDDDKHMIAAFGTLLETEGAVVALSGGAEAALQLAVERRFDAILSDIGMPIYDGHWLARQLRLDPRTAGVALIAITGMSRDADRVMAIEAGFDAVIGKPIVFDAMRVEVVRAIVKRGGAGKSTISQTVD